MAVRSNPYFRAAMEFVHDIAAGAFPGAVLAGWLIQRQFTTASPDTIRLIKQASTSLWLILLASLVLLLATGAFRLGYWKLNIREGFLKTKQRMILVKHTAFVLLLIGSIVFMFTLVPT